MTKADVFTHLNNTFQVVGNEVNMSSADETAAGVTRFRVPVWSLGTDTALSRSVDYIMSGAKAYWVGSAPESNILTHGMFEKYLRSQVALGNIQSAVIERATDRYAVVKSLANDGSEKVGYLSINDAGQVSLNMAV